MSAASREGLAGPAHVAKRLARGRSVRTRRVVALRASAPLLCLGGAKTCFCLLTGSLEPAHPCRAGEPLSIGLGLVQVVALAGVLSLCSQIVQMPGGHAFERRGFAVVGLSWR
jgi:hypothetical protein